MVLNSTFKFIESCCLRIELTKLETKLLLLLSDNELHNYEEVCNYLYNNFSNHTRNSLTSILKRLRLKLDIIVVKTNIGLICNNKILIDR